MKDKYIKRTSDNSIDFLLEKGFTREISMICASRGVNEENFDEYFGHKNSFHSPFDMANMQEVVDTISIVMENGGSILICGDYDADGLTASAELSLYFSDNGIDNDIIIPTRDEGYGLHADAVIKAFEKKFYDLVITVDCGISNADEVRKIIDELGVEVIVTDHHELPENLPDCICLNPKIGYPFPYLSGSGVAWKLIEALSGFECAKNYAYLACIGTIGDLMSMTDENRSLVKLGLSNRNHKGLQKLAELSKCDDNLTCSDVAMKIAPKINGAGRVGYPLEALKLLLSRDKVNVAQAQKLLELNETRKKMLDSIVSQVDNLFDERSFYKNRLIFLQGEDWPHGVLGIVASKYKEKYNLPTVVVTRDGNNYIGSARSVDGVNLFEVFNKCSNLLVKFGGHNASVGFTVAENNLDVLKNQLSQILCSMDAGLFDKKIFYDAELGIDCSAQELYDLSNALQPLLPQNKILCRVRDSVKFANAFGKDGAHLSVTLSNGLELKGFFKYGKYASIVKDGANVDVICSLEVDSYSKNITGIIEDISICNSVCLDEFYKINLVKNFSPNFEKSCSTDFEKILQEESLLVVFDDYETFLSYVDKYNFDDFSVDLFFGNSTNRKTVVISPLSDYPFVRFNNVLVFGKNAYQRCIKDAVYVEVVPAREDLYKVDLNRDICGMVFVALKKKNNFESIKSVYDKFLLNRLSYSQFVSVLRIFEELEIVKIVDNFTIQLNTAVKRDLNDSKIYKCLQTEKID